MKTLARRRRGWWRISLGLLLMGLWACGGGEPDPALGDPGKPPGDPIQPGTNNPPELERIGDRVVGVGETLVITLTATDPDGDALTYTLYGTLPSGAKFSKTDHRFEWTPLKAGETVWVTFTVSDGTDFDRETVRIEVVSEAGNHPPTFQPVGDQSVAASYQSSLQLVATDPDGDPITFGVDGAMPQGAFLDPASGLYQWTPAASLVGQTVRVTFTAHDGSLKDSLEVTFIVQGEGGSGPSPPAILDIPAQVVTAGQTVSFVLQTMDSDGDVVQVAIHGGAPPAAALIGNQFNWVTGAPDAGMSWSITFSATDGMFTTYLTVDVTVNPAGTPTGSCSADAYEPNPNLAGAAPVSIGTLQANLCDSAEGSSDADYYALTAPSGGTLTVTLTFDPGLGDIDLTVSSSSGDVLASSMGLSSPETCSVPVTAGQSVYVTVFGVGQQDFASPYTLTMAMGPATSCTDDVFEPNETLAQAWEVPAVGTSLTICPGDSDMWALPLVCGQNLTVTMDTGGTVDLDMTLWLDTDTGSYSLAQAVTTQPIEILELDPVPETATYGLKVVAWPASTGTGQYTLSTTTAGGCDDDTFAGGTIQQAKTLTGSEGAAEGMTLCCSSDWFALDMGAGDQATIGVSLWSQTGAAGIIVYGPDMVTQLASLPPSSAGASLPFTATVAGIHRMEVSGITGTDYTLTWSASEEVAGSCTDLSCPKYKVCDFFSGSCLSDFCQTESDCPLGYTCKETYCTSTCQGPANCRTNLGYACKSFAEGKYCGISGWSAAGASCYSHAACEGEAVCAFQDNGGYCAVMACGQGGSACPAGTWCVPNTSEGSLCGKNCGVDSDCRVDEGYSCASQGVCLP